MQDDLLIEVIVHAKDERVVSSVAGRFRNAQVVRARKARCPDAKTLLAVDGSASDIVEGLLALAEEFKQGQPVSVSVRNYEGESADLAHSSPRQIELFVERSTRD